MGSYPELPGWKGASETGREAALAYASEAKGRRAQVLRAMADGPGTAEEIGGRIGLHWYLTRPRLSELRNMGYVADSGERGKGALGGKVIRWRLLSRQERAEYLAKQAEGEAADA
jgi:DNA-binding IclR family transcriptional regulator